MLVKADGETTYFAADAAYYLRQARPGQRRLSVYMLGADHHGYVNRLKAIAACAGDDMNRNIEVMIGQFVKMLRDGEEVRMSKRAGNIITIDDVVDWIGVDAARYTLSRSSTDSTITLDINLLTTQGNENPVYYVQYAHARMCRVGRKAEQLGVDKGAVEDFKPELLATEWESDILGALGEFPRIVAKAGRAARAAPRGALPGGAGRQVPPLLRELPGPAQGRRGAERHPPCPALAGRGDQDGAGQRPRPARRHSPRADVATTFARKGR